MSVFLGYFTRCLSLSQFSLLSVRSFTATSHVASSSHHFTIISRRHKITITSSSHATAHHITPPSMIPSDQVGNAQSCAEHAIFLCLSILRQYTRLLEAVRPIQPILTPKPHADVNQNPRTPIAQVQLGALGSPTGRTIAESSIMIYGFGNLGKQVG